MHIESHKRICETVRRSLSGAVVASIAAASLLGCAIMSPHAGKPVDYARQMKALSLELKKKNQVIEDLKERNLVLEHRESVILSQKEQKPAPLPDPKLGPEVSESIAEPLAEPMLVPETKANASVQSGENGEHFLYSKILDTYRTHNQTEMQATLRLLLRTYPESVFADNALYLSGLQAAELGDSKTALQSFDQLIREYPHSNKLVSALFAKAGIQKRLGRKPDAVRGYQMVRDLFPGSPEASRVSLELKLLGQTTLKRRET